MNQPGETDTRNMPTGTEDAFKVPDCLCTAPRQLESQFQAAEIFTYALG